MNSHLTGCHIYFIYNFRRLDKIFQEVYYWERLNIDIPHYVRMVYNRKEELRSLKEHVLLVVRDYNRLEIKALIMKRNVCMLFSWKKKLEKKTNYHSCIEIYTLPKFGSVNGRSMNMYYYGTSKSSTIWLPNQK